MKTPILAAAALALTFALGPAAAVAADEQSEAKPAKEKKICRTYKVTGSLTRRTRVCRTESEWRAADEATYKGVSDMQGSASGAGKCIGLNCDQVPGM